MELNLPNIIPIFQSLSLVKIVTLVFLILYAVFSFVVLTQVNIMNQILNQTNASATLKTIAILIFVLAISLILAALVIL